MKRILYIRQNKPGGTDNYCKALSNLFTDDTELQALPVCDIPTISSRLFHYYYRPASLNEAIKDADIIHINGYTAMGTVQAFLAAYKNKKKIVYTAHWHPFECLRHPFLGKMFFYLFLRPLIKKYAHVVTTINNEDTSFFQSIHPHVVQIPHWYKPQTLNHLPVKNKKMLLFVGRTDDPVKGIEHLYELPKEKYEIHCVGKGELLRKDFHQYIGISDNELAELYAQASVLVVPSKYEAFSYAALEALSYGTPVVLSERVRIADYLTGINGWFVFQYHDYKDFLEKIDLAINAKVDMMSVRQVFTPEKVKKTYRDIYLS